MNYYALISFLISLVSVFFGLFVFEKHKKSPLNRIFLILCLFLSYSTFVEFMYRQSDIRDTAVFWIRLNSFWPFIFPIILHFVLVLTERIGKKFRWPLRITLYLPPAGLTVYYLTKKWAATEIVQKPWGWSYMPVPNPVFSLMVLLWILAVSITAIWVGVGFYFSTRDRIKKKQIQFVWLGIGSAVSGAAVLRILSYLLGVPWPELDTIMILPVFGFFGYAILRYKLFVLSVETSAESVLATLADALLLVNTEGVVVRTNPAAEKLLGMRNSRLEGMKIRDVFGDAQFQKRIRTRELLKDGMLKYIETYFRNARGDFVPVGLSVSVVRDEFGREQGMVFLFRDLTERRKIEEELWKYRNRLEKMVEERTLELTKVNLKLQDEISHGKTLEENLRESEQKYRDLIEHQDEIVCRFDPDFAVTFVNAAALKFLRMEEGELTGKKWILLVPKFQRRRAEDDFEQLKKDPKPDQYQMPIMSSDGAVRWFDWRITPVRDAKGRVVEYQASGRDITERKEIEENYHRVQDRIRAIYEAADRIAFIVTDTALPLPRILEFSPGAEKIFGLDRDEAVGQSLSIVCCSDSPNPVPGILKAILQTRKSLTGTVMMHRNTGGPFNVYHSTSPLLNDQGDIDGILITALDMSEFDAVRDKLREKEWQQKAILNNIPDIAWLKDRDSVFLAVNEAFGKRFGQDPDRIVGKTDFDIVPRADAEHYRKDDREVIRSGKRKVIEEGIEFPGGQHAVIETLKTPVRNEEGEILGTAGIARDITIRKEMEAAIERSLREKETLLREIHHRLKNNLQVISGVLDLESRSLGESRVGGMIQNAVARLETMALIHSLLTDFIRSEEVDMDVFLDRLSQSLVKVHQKPGRNVRIRRDAKGIRLPFQKTMPLGLIINELITNSLVHAFRGSKTGEISLSILEENGRIRMTYQDDGSGLPDGTNLFTAKSTGFQLVTSLSKQLSGTLLHSKGKRGRGLKITLDFENRPQS